MRRKNWIEPAPVEAKEVARLVAELGVPAVVARVLVGRGKSDPAEARRFLNPSIDQLSPPRRLRGADVAVDRLLRALSRNERILIFGDFDVDGVTGTSLAVRALRQLGANVDFLMPKRLVHGYGLSMKIIPELTERKPAVVVTVDCGIRSVDEVARLAELGIETIVTDHHSPGPSLPPATAVVDPKQLGCEYPDKRLAGVGVVFQLLRGIVDELEHELDLSRDLDLVAFGTIADVVPLDGENRALVHEGLEVMNRREKVGIMALAQASGIEGRIEAWHIGYLLGPRINAAGRLEDSADAVHLLTTEDTGRANKLARQLDEENRRRQEFSATTLEQALTAIANGTAGEDPDGIVLASNGWHPGVIGIATARLVDRYHRPAALIAMEGDVGRGSLRSIPGVDVCSILDECRDLLVQYGGHEMAAGLTIDRGRIPEFRERFAAGCSRRLTDDNRRPRLRIDGEIDPREIDIGLATDLERLAPFGFGNPRPTFLLRGAATTGPARVVGRGHLKLSIKRNGGPPLDCIGFDLGDRIDADALTGPLDIVGHVTINEWNDRRSEQLQLIDVRETVS
ncbi:MAG: single-stranded-DNA-specific exonuclease RecJ [Candidatus Eiseniibacteriota bacterium]